MNSQVINITPSVQRGFTLIELMVVVVIIAILAAIAIPSYRQYTIRNAESQALARMKQLELELTGWRATALTYKGFMPKQIDNSGTVSYGYADSGTNTKILVPDATNTNYTIILTADSAGSSSLNPSTASNAVMNTWYMFATPNANLSNYGAKKLLLSNSGLACKSSADSFNATSTCNTTDTMSLTK